MDAGAQPLNEGHREVHSHERPCLKPTFQDIKWHMLSALDGLLDQQLEVLRQKEERNSMISEDDRSHLIAELAAVNAVLDQSIAARDKLEGKYCAMKSNMKLLAEQYEELHSQVASARNANQYAAPSSKEVPPKESKFPHPEQKQAHESSLGSEQRGPSKAAAGSGKIRRILSTKSASATTAAIFSRSERTVREFAAREAGPRSISPLPAGPQQGDENRAPSSLTPEGLGGEATAAVAKSGRQQHDGGQARSGNAKATTMGRVEDQRSCQADGHREAPEARTARRPRQKLEQHQEHRQSIGSEAREAPYVQTNLTKEARAQLPGHTCAECEAFYAAQKAKGVDSEEIRDILNTCSRHRQQWAPKSTPEGFWDMSAMSMPTPRPLKKRALDDIA